jgi:hypothetical protein
MNAAHSHDADATTAALPHSKRRVVAAAYFLLFFGPGTALLYIPRYLEHLGMSDAEIGVLVGLQPLLRWTSALAFAHVADHWRIRQPLLLAYTTLGGFLFVPFLVVFRSRAADAVLRSACCTAAHLGHRRRAPPSAVARRPLQPAPAVGLHLVHLRRSSALPRSTGRSASVPAMLLPSALLRRGDRRPRAPSRPRGWAARRGGWSRRRSPRFSPPCCWCI